MSKLIPRRASYSPYDLCRSRTEMAGDTAAQATTTAMGNGLGVVPRWTVSFLIALAVGLVAWTLYLTYVLPAHHVTDEWRLAWAGFDLALATTIAFTALGIATEAPWLEAAAATTTHLLCTDPGVHSVLFAQRQRRLAH